MPVLKRRRLDPAVEQRLRLNLAPRLPESHRPRCSSPKRSAAGGGRQSSLTSKVCCCACCLLSFHFDSASYPQRRPDIIHTPTASAKRALFQVCVLCATKACQPLNRAWNPRLSSVSLATYKRQHNSTAQTVFGRLLYETGGDKH